MEISTVSATSSSSEFVRWEEVYSSSDKGRREVHYYLKRMDGTSDLAVVGKEKSSRHMSYRYACRDRSVLPVQASFLSKLRSRSEVVDWLNSVVTDSHPHQSLQAIGGSFGSKNTGEFDMETLRDVQLRKLGHCTKEFLWLGASWTCRKRRRHYWSFCRNGVKISVHDFVFVLAEEDKRLVAYLEDMYEDYRGNKMVVVRWFHKVDEVGIVLPENYNDREIFFSLCLQDLSIECIDGLATVLSPQHYKKFLSAAKDTQLEPFVCCRQFDNDDIKPFDITQVKDYWKQEILRYMFTAPPSKDHVKSQPSEHGLTAERNFSIGIRCRPKKRLRKSKDGESYFLSDDKQEHLAPCLDDGWAGLRGGIDTSGQKDGAFMPGKQVMQKPSQHLTIGSQVEVLSQDSGLRGCWFRALIIKKHKDKVKVRYQDIKDAADETNNLEEWLLASRVAVADPLGLRLCGRPTIRPTPKSNKVEVPFVVNVGAVVDVWWHEGWWEGIVIKKETPDQICVYFPGEKQESTFGSHDLRHSEEWLGNGWEHVKERPDLIISILSDLETKQKMVKPCDVELEEVAIGQRGHIPSPISKGSFSVKDEVGRRTCHMLSVEDKPKGLEIVRDLSKDTLLTRLKWKSSRKRRRVNSVQKLHYLGDEKKSSPEAVGSRTLSSIFISNTLKVDHDNCKYMGDSPFSSSVVAPLTNLVMSR
ncbi:uncharacterized protein LOC127797249 [Diospyros lotus]|uniref:uncharacterized protein LOC127797249 n=1 Tax=Diospyros lotus TaxID=55363 RepID=UPI00225631DC|nr:uncharacterized protein LOC127797249 [Diospyros lotus]